MRSQISNISLTSSDIVRAYTSTKYQLVLRDDRQKFYKFKTQLRKRRTIQNANMKKLNIKPPEKDKISSIQKFLDSFRDFKYHIMSEKQIANKLQTDLQLGVSHQKADQLFELKPNIIEGPPKTPWPLVFLSQMSDPFSLFIWFLIVLCCIGFGALNDVNQLLLAIILLVTLISGALISFGFVRESQSTIKNFQNLVPTFTTVIRSGQVQSLKSKRVVVGDLVRLRVGDKIPADIRLVKCLGLKTNRATFTGQTYPVEATTQCTNQKNPLESLNILYSGIQIVEGEGIGIVINTGESTLISKLQKIIINSQKKQSFLQKQISRFVKIITIFALAIGLFVFVGGSIIGFPVVIAADMAIGVMVASAPGVLNLQLICILYISVIQLAKKKFICKNLVAVQSFGSAQILCTDKTGTLTTNKMTVDNLYYNNRIFKATNIQDFNEEYQHQYDQHNITFKNLHKCAILSAVASFDKSPPRKDITNISSRTDIILSQKQIKQRQIQKAWKQNEQNRKISQKQIIGDSTESALVRFFHPIQQIQKTKDRFPITNNKKGENRILFNSIDKYSLSINSQKTHNSHFCINIKGAPEKIWGLCKYIMEDGQLVPKQYFMGLNIKQIVQKWGKQGKRVLGFAQLRLPALKYHSQYQFDMNSVSVLLKDMTFLGLISLQDPPRKGVGETIQTIKKAGIRVIMITGDQQSTALSIGRQCNIISVEPTVKQLQQNTNCSYEQAFFKAKNIVLNGQQISQLINQQFIKQKNDQGKAFTKILQKQGIIFARTSPSQKLFIVQQLQKLNYIVAVTGDGSNDSPAIKIANAGIAMGSGSDTAHDSADIIIANDDLNLLIDGIEHGRRALDNFKKAICYVMTSQISQWAPFIFLIFTRIPIPIFTLLIDGAADFVPTIAFAFQESEKDIMTRPPQKNKEHLINFALLLQCQGWVGFSSFLSCLCCYYIVMVDFGFVPSNLWGKSNVFILLENNLDFYNPSDPYFGNTNLSSIKTCDEFLQKAVRVDWINSSYPKTDLRMSGVQCLQNKNGDIMFEQIFQFAECRLQQISPITNKPICYTPQASKYGQTSYMYANVINQVFNWIICRTRRQSGILKRFNNSIFVFGLSCELMLAISLSYTSFMITLIGTRDVVFEHYGIGTIPYAIIQLCLQQIRKYLIRNMKKNKEGQANWFQRTVMW